VAGTATIAVTATDSRGAESGAVAFQVTVLPPDRPAWALPRAAPAAVDATPCAVDGVLAEVFTDRAMQSALLVVDGQVVGERYAPGYDHTSRGTSWSVAKSFYSAAIGVAIDEGDIESVEQKASDFLTEWLGTNKENITIRQILEMRSGLGDGDVFSAFDQTQFALNQGRIAAPGTRFIYSNPNSQLFEPLLRRATGLDAHDWLTRKVLEPIGIDPSAVGFWLDPTGTQPLTYCCLDMRPDDFARFGLLYLNGGTWDGQQVVSEGYVRQSLAAQSAFYGFQWWVLNSTYFYPRTPPIDVVAAHGLDGQHIYLWRDANAALVVLTRYLHDSDEGYVLSLANWPNTCAARNTCWTSTGEQLPAYDEYRVIERLAAVRR
jgi:CubicO group peptidase (beta-lactamase class C family)